MSGERIVLRHMAVWALAVDSLTKSPIVILKEVGGEKTLPIWIGILEAISIASELQGVKFLRPTTHDLLKNILELIDAKVNNVEICDLKNNTYYALINIAHYGEGITIDARPSDAIALSLRMNAPIFVLEQVINKSKQIDLEMEPEDKSEQGKKWQEILEKMDPKDFGNT